MMNRHRISGRSARLPGYNAYRKLTGRSPTRDFAEISDDKEVCSRLKEVYKTVDRVEFYPGLFAEPVRTNAALPLLAAELVAVDAFSQALTNPLLSDHLFNGQTFTKVGMEVIKSTTCLSDILNRNLPAGSSRYYLSMTRDEKQLRDGLPLAGAPAAIAIARGTAGAVAEFRGHHT